jgi:hypothetical protein
MLLRSQVASRRRYHLAYQLVALLSLKKFWLYDIINADKDIGKDPIYLSKD